MTLSDKRTQEKRTKRNDLLLTFLSASSYMDAERTKLFATHV